MPQPMGQNFLVDKTAAAKIIEAADLGPDDDVIEIGPGKGVLTSYIASKAGSVHAIEIDKRLSIKLENKFNGMDKVKIINQDFLSYKIPDELRKVKLIANLPYYAASKIIQVLLPQRIWTKAVFMVQKEVAERIVSEKDRSSYGYLSIFCQYYADFKILLICKPECFFPKPLVDSAVLVMTNKNPQEPDEDLFRVVKYSFSQKRKTILNSLSNALNKEKPLILDVLQKANIDPILRPENLSIETYQNLTFLLKKCSIL